jgi:outer membrane protein assembly factor BamE
MRNTILLLALFCAACSGYSFKPYRMDIQQGNVVTPKMMMQLRPGMSKAQVRYVMGTPLIVDAFRVNRWDYLYRMEKGGKLIEERHVVLEFDNDKLARVTGDVIPAGSSGDALPAAVPVKPGAAVAPLPLPSFEQPAAPATAPAAKPEPALESQAAPAPMAEPTPPVEAPKAAQKPEPQAAPVPKAIPQAAPVVAPVPKAEPKPEPAPEPKTESQQAPAPTPKAEPKPAPKPEAKPQPKPVPKPVEEDLPPEEDPSYFERMLEKIGF